MYADYAAGAPLLKEARAEFLRVSKYVGNPSSIHEEGRIARRELENARKMVAHFFNTKADEVIFTASGTESNLVAIGGVIEEVALRLGRYENVFVVSSTIEHPSIRETLLFYQKKGVSVQWVVPREDGILDPIFFKAIVTNKTSLVVLHHVNSEIGTIQPISEIVSVVKSAGNPHVHVDACQSAPWIPVHLDTLRVDTIAIDSLKVGGPRGVGALAVARGVVLRPIITGGGQEAGLRSGTQNVPGIAGFARALSVIAKKRKGTERSVLSVRNALLKMIQESLPEVIVNGTLKHRVPNNVNVSFRGINADVVVTKLDVLGVAASTGTACAVGEQISPVVLAIAPQDVWRAQSAVRFTIGPYARISDVKKIKNAYVQAVAYARESFKELKK